MLIRFLVCSLHDGHNYRFTEDTMYVRASSAADTAKQYEVTLNFLHKIVPDTVVVKNTNCIQWMIKKAKPELRWASLTNDMQKPHFLKVDFNKWQDDESDCDNLSDKEDIGNGLGGIDDICCTFDKFSIGNFYE